MNHPCQMTESESEPAGWTPCPAEADVRVKLFESDGTAAEHDFCHPHAKLVAGEYPDNIKLVKSYGH